MSVTLADVERMALLARLRLEPEEVRRLTVELNGILQHMAELSSLDVSRVVAYTSAAEADALPRRDEPGADLLHGYLIDIAPALREGFFTVPRLVVQTDPVGTPVREPRP
jgi:aspartyl-tRNA(Asn)/glutamyl-tRNA(Gln) amidotransferase subunit C